ncbi:unnamed protein product [Prunus armeniaca]
MPHNTHAELKRPSLPSPLAAGRKSPLQWLLNLSNEALLSLLIATLFDDAIEYVVGSNISVEAWTHLQDRYATVSRAHVNHLKTKFHTIHKGADSIEKYLLWIKIARDQLFAVGERITDDDMVIIARDSTIGLKDL